MATHFLFLPVGILASDPFIGKRPETLPFPVTLLKKKGLNHASHVTLLLGKGQNHSKKNILFESVTYKALYDL